jgi:predicted kinase
MASIVWENRLIVLVGLPGCGKSTWAAAFRPSHGRVVSSDGIRAEICGDENNQDRNAEVFEVFHQRIRDGLAQGRDVIADATHLTERSRRETFLDAPKNGAQGGVRVEAIFFDNPTQAIMRNAQRTRRVPENVMYTMLRRHDVTQRAIYDEAFDSVTTISRFDYRGA